MSSSCQSKLNFAVSAPTGKTAKGVAREEPKHYHDQEQRQTEGGVQVLTELVVRELQCYGDDQEGCS